MITFSDQGEGVQHPQPQLCSLMLDNMFPRRNEIFVIFYITLCSRVKSCHDMDVTVYIVAVT